MLSQKQDVLVSVPRQMTPRAVIVSPIDRGSARHTPRGDGLSKANTSASSPGRMNLKGNGPRDCQAGLPQSGGSGTPALRHSSKYAWPPAVVAERVLISP